MKRIISRIIGISMLLTMMLSAAVCVNADGQTDVIFTSDSSFQVGGTATVDLTKTAQTVLNDDAISSDVYNAALEKNMAISWICSSGAEKTGKSVTWTSADAGKEYVCRVSFYADKELTEFVAFIDSEPFTVAGGAKPTILTTELPEAVVGQDYYVKLQCTDPDAVFAVYDHPEKANELDSSGLHLTQHGELEGKPEYLGRFVFSVRASNSAGEDIKTYILDVAEGAVTVVEILQAPNKVNYYIGETLDLTGLKVRVTKPDGTSFESHNGEQLTVSTGPMAALGEQKIRVAYGDAFDLFIVTVEEKPVQNPTITTESLPNAIVGQDYYVKLICTDPDAVFGEWHNPGSANDLDKTGLILTQHGELEGVPSAAGTYTFTIYASGEGGEGYKTYTLVVKEAEGTDEPTEPNTEATGTPTETLPEGTEPTDPTENATQGGGNEPNENEDSGKVWLVVAIVLGVLTAGMVVAIIVILKKNKA